MAEEEVEVQKTKMHKMNASLDHETWTRLWNYIKKRYDSPWRAYSKTVREAIKEYLDRHESELEGKD